MNKELPIVFFKKDELSEQAAVCHDSFDIIYVLSGKLQIETEQKSDIYPAGHICVLNPNQSYVLTPFLPNNVLYMGIAPSFVFSLLTDYGFLICDSAAEPGNDYTQIKTLLGSIATKYMESPVENEIYIQGLLLLLLDELRQNSKHILPIQQLEQMPDKYHERARKIASYIQLHYNEPISLSDLSDEIFLSTQYISAFMKKYMNTTFKKLLNEKRLFHALHDIQYTDLSMTDIAIRNGFTNTNTFYKNFRAAFNLPPQEYRKKYMKDSKTVACADFPAVSKLSNVINLFSNPQTIIVDVSKAGLIQSKVCRMINIGSVHSLLSRKYQKALVDCRLDFQYVRIQEVISSSFIPRILPHYDYYFQNADIVMSFLYQNDFIPVIELSKQYGQTQTPLPASGGILRNSRYFNLFENFLSHCASHWPSTWLSQWKFELWLSPKDLIADYIRDFVRLKHLIKRYVPDACIGGPGYDYCFSGYTLEDCLTAFQKENVQPDFISISLNLFTCEQKTLQINADKQILSKQCKNARNTIRKYFPNLPMYVTEWRSLSIPGMPVAQSRFQAAFICKSILEIQKYCDLCGYWLFMNSAAMDKALYYSDYWEQGLLNTIYIKSSGYYAFAIMNQSGSEIISSAANCCVTRKSSGHYYAIAYNYACIDSAHANSAIQNCDFEKIYDIFEKTPSLELSLVLTCLSPGYYRITRQLIDEFHGSYLDMLIGEFAHSNFPRSDFLQYAKESFHINSQYRIQSCIPEERIIYIAVEQTLTLPTLLPAHCVCAWDIQKLL